jgi:hypothetical protein
MKLRFVPVLILCLPFLAIGSPPGMAGGCGWDYPCSPDPQFGRPHYRSGHVTIQNNYGSVNIYSSRRAAPPPFEDRGEPEACQDEACLRYGCGGYPCTDKCGPGCWLRRLRQGYCGHGCQSYVENAQIEAGEREEWREEAGIRPPPPPRDEWMYEKRSECAPPYCPPDYEAAPPPPPVAYPPPPVAYYERRAPERGYDGPPRRRPEPYQTDLTPRGRFEGPAYPPR